MRAMTTGSSFGGIFGKTRPFLHQRVHLRGRVRIVTTRLAFVQAGLQLSDWLDHCGGVEKFWREVANLLSHYNLKDIPSEILAKGMRHLELTGMTCERLLFCVPTKTQRPTKVAATPCKFPVRKTSKKTTITLKPSDLLRFPFAVNWRHGSKRRPKGCTV